MDLHAVAVSAHYVERVLGLGKAEQQREALGGIGSAGNGAEAFRITGNVLEQDRRRRGLAVDDLGERTISASVPISSLQSAPRTRISSPARSKRWIASRRSACGRSYVIIMADIL
jgi:hypothetical protein